MSTHPVSRRFRLCLLVSALCAAAATARADDDGGLVGLAFGYSTEFKKPVVVGELIWPYASPVRFNLNLEYLKARGVRRFTTSLDVVYHHTLPIYRRLDGWAGAGFGLVTKAPVGPAQPTTRDGQVNWLLGVGFEGQVSPYVQARLEARKATFTFGLRLAI